MQKKVDAVIPAAGYGRLTETGARSKLLAEIAGKSIIQRVIENVRASEYVDRIVVIVNDLMRNDLEAVLRTSGHSGVYFKQQPKRRGAADAVSQAMPLFDHWGVENFLVIFGELPLIKTETINEIIESHFQRNPVISLLTYPFQPTHPLAFAVRSYAFLHRNGGNGTSPALSMYEGKVPAEGDDVIGSLYVLNRVWFGKHWLNEEIPPENGKHVKDGYGPEFHLPHLPVLAAAKDDPCLYLRRDIPHEILGVNTDADLELVRRVYKED